MSLISSIFDREPWPRRRNRMWDLSSHNDFGGLFDFPGLRIGSTRSTTKQEAALVGKDGFQVCVDVQHFKPEEITVKTVEGTVVVEANHEERQDEHGFISRMFRRKYVLPKGYDSNDVVSSLSSDGVLTIKATPPMVKEIEQGKEHVIPIQQTGQAH